MTKKPKKPRDYVGAVILVLFAVAGFFLVKSAWDLHVSACELHVRAAEDFRERWGRDYSDNLSTYRDCKSIAKSLGRQLHPLYQV